MLIDIRIVKERLWNFRASNLPTYFGCIAFRDDGRIGGYLNQNECFWECSNESLDVLDRNKILTARYRFSDFNEDGWFGEVKINGAANSHILSVNRSTPISVPFNSDMEKIAERGSFYFGHFKRRGDVYKKDQNVIVYPNAYIEPTAILPVGSIYNMGAFSYHSGGSTANLSVGRYCSIAGGLQVFGNSHPTSWLTSSPVSYTSHHFRLFQEAGINTPPELCEFEEKNNHIVTNIGNDVWIGADCMLKPGITIGNGAIIAARSVVTKDVPPYAIVAGIPAEIRKYRFDEKIVSKLLSIEWWNFNLSNCNIIWNDVERSLEILESELERQFIKKIDFGIQNWSVAIVGTRVLDLS